MDKSRQQFEEWRSKNKSSTINLFDVWQASRENAEPEIKHHQLRELVNTARDTAIKYQGCQCLRSALEASIRNSLTSNGVKIKDE
ncbi:hypothetical protein [Proteus mirabilis]|uniref:hypothetical protein n=1 Tax=Proteus mirabilis TaxID=584 RepID=UPI0007C19527|nr:hypothetical protein [Proteus mirabilis]AND12545.1 hypothetical protein AOUC001_06540 [Proteus mirabilis]AND13530.1 hypothetical protein AOUC001_11755 [Proteus mirabilis]MBG2969522.1 hypothetical protein [Proteus mirabilis]MCJ8514999.1 hypothetical protein [Proteus mirabilis]MDK6973268.1 hypothetical protein [Proteus mirabilis]